MAVITSSVFELLKIGPGPSSSHTIGPMKAGHDFSRLMQTLPPQQQAAATAIEVQLYGSLAATGQGHGTDRAVLAGLCGQTPESCPPDQLEKLSLAAGVVHPVRIGTRTIDFGAGHIRWDNSQHAFPYSNTLIFRLLADGQTLLEREYYSVGGGFLQWKGQRESARGKPRYPYGNAAELWSLLKEHGLSLDELMIANEMAITGMDADAVNLQLDRLISVMQESVRLGVHTEGVLPGPIGLHRKAALMHRRATAIPSESERLLVHLCAYAFAAAEENAAGHVVVTAPTCGSAGVIPAVVTLLLQHLNLPRDRVRKALLASAAIGLIAKQNASISGAEVGCQGEIGVASSMAAFLIAYATGSDVLVAENAAETALEHHLGMTCDPVKGYVQIPCIERNAMGAVKAYTAWLIAREGLTAWHVVSLDHAIEAMNQTGRDMRVEYRETAQGGLARYC